MEKKMTLEINETCGIMAALTAYQAGGDRETAISRIRLVTGWQLENAGCFYDMVQRDGVYMWRNTVIESVARLISANNELL